jgi:hypothetical protein
MVLLFAELVSMLEVYISLNSCIFRRIVR